MQTSTAKQRIALSVQILSDLQQIHGQLIEISKVIEASLPTFYKNFVNQHKDSIKNDIDKYKINIEKINHLNNEITAKVNAWYSFIKSTNEMEKFLYPFHFFVNQKQLKIFLQKSQESISALMIENRFLKEKLLNWEQNLMRKAIEQIKQAKDYQDYEQAKIKKNMLISELRYLLSTLPYSKPIVVEIDGIDKLIHTLLESVGLPS